jgi:hypothetical protein
VYSVLCQVILCSSCALDSYNHAHNLVLADTALFTLVILYLQLNLLAWKLPYLFKSPSVVWETITDLTSRSRFHLHVACTETWLTCPLWLACVAGGVNQETSPGPTKARNRFVCVTLLNYRSDLALFPSIILSSPLGVHLTVTDALAVAVHGRHHRNAWTVKTCKRGLPNRLFLTFEQCWTPHRAVAGDTESLHSHVRSWSDETFTTYRPAGFKPHTTYGYEEMWWDAASDQGSPTASPRPPARVPSEEVHVLQVF